MVQNIGAVLCRTADADNPPGATGDQSLCVDKKAAAVLCRGAPSKPWQQSFSGTQLTLGAEKWPLVLTVNGRK